MTLQTMTPLGDDLLSGRTRLPERSGPRLEIAF
jgi:hypothetical protein